jgi:hypothetical protein
MHMRAHHPATQRPGNSPRYDEPGRFADLMATILTATEAGAP